ncbi:penicillin-binding transpeptidase domain-containing protein [Jiangella gansuensis]|uniref:penicillin-binding transpeptidase domain-containing protein n=1 Tax=Jiangella gansuensis TaxID=281473 RepID=UPI0004ADC1CB|nr:penicillin-binding transpeptidase domain-containing protein [Jiangella gansuensis]
MTSKDVLRRATTAALGGVLVAAAAGCSSTPDAEPVAQALAEAVASGDFSDVPLSGTTPEEAAAAVEELTAGMGSAARTIEVADIEQTDDEDSRQVTLDVSWDLDAVAAPEQPEETGDATADSATPAADPTEPAGTDTDADADAGDWTYQTTAVLVAADTDAGWEVEWAPSVVHPELTDGASLGLRRQQADRADILGAGGEVIVTERPVYRVGIDKTQVDAAAAPASATALAELVGVDAAAFAGRVEAAGERAYVEAITLREADAAPFLPGIEQIEGAAALSDTQALAPTREFARPILGTVGEATAEIVEESAGRVVAGDVVGLSGLQAQYDAQLAGTPGLTVELTPAEGDAQVLFEREAVGGSPVTTTLDLELQARAEGLLADVGPASGIVAVQPSTGSVLAAASGPGGEGYSTATLGQYAPGSTFKIATALALLRAGLTPDSTVTCSPTVTVDGRSFENYSDYPSGAIGDITLRSAIANSCNTALIGQNQTVDQAALAEAAASLGLGAEHATGAPAFLGSVPAEADGTAHAASMIGQGEVLASPLAMATMAASVVAGQTVAPVLVEGAAGEAPASTLTPEEAQTLRDLMLAVVEDGSGAFLGDVPGDPVGAKTGTAEYGTEQPPRTHAWMVGFQGDLAVAVFVEDGESGSQTAGPLLEAFLRG